MYKKKTPAYPFGVLHEDLNFTSTQRNPKVGFALDFFGENNRARRLITYAASFGSTTYEKLCSYKVDAQIKNDLKRFDAISVRDNNSYSIVEELCGVKSNLNLDPVLVSGIENEPWIEANIENFIIVYGYAGRFAEEEKQAIVEFAHKNKLKTISLCDYQDFCDQHIVCRPDEILGYFKKANYIVTDTFHGTIFSVIFHKQFGTFCRSKSNTGSTNQEKLLDLLHRLQLENQLIKDVRNLETSLTSEIDYESVDLIREQEKAKSINYLRANISIPKER